MADKLTEDKGLMSSPDKLFYEGGKHLQLRAFNAGVIVQQPRVAAGLTKFHDLCQDLYMPAFFVFAVFQLINCILTKSFIKMGLLLTHLHIQGHLGAGGQFFQNL